MALLISCQEILGTQPLSDIYGSKEFDSEKSLILENGHWLVVNAQVVEKKSHLEKERTKRKACEAESVPSVISVCRGNVHTCFIHTQQSPMHEFPHTEAKVIKQMLFNDFSIFKKLSLVQLKRKVVAY